MFWAYLGIFEIYAIDFTIMLLVTVLVAPFMSILLIDPPSGSFFYDFTWIRLYIVCFAVFSSSRIGTKSWICNWNFAIKILS